MDNFAQVNIRPQTPFITCHFDACTLFGLAKMDAFCLNIAKNIQILVF